jgi:hypothetical protein
MTQDDYFIITINHGTVKKSNEAIIVRSTWLVTSLIETFK